MNVFVTDLAVDNAVTHVQGFSSGIFIFFEKLCVQYEGIWNNMWLPCTVNVQHSTVFFTDFRLKQDVGFHMKHIIWPHFIQLLTPIQPEICQ